MLKRLFIASFAALLLLITPLTTAFAAATGGEENGAGGSLMEGPFVILAFATIIIMVYYCIRD